MVLSRVFLSSAQEVLPFVENYTKAVYQGDNQNWGVVQGTDGAMYFANNRFLLRYNGVVWEKYTLPNKTIIRSVFVDGSKIYTGSYTEFGYWQRKNGVLAYTSLSKDKALFTGHSNNEEIWKIFKSKDKIFFQSFNELFIYDFVSIKKVRIPFQISYCFQVSGQIYVASVKQGLFTFEQNQFKKVEKWKVLDNKIVHSIEKQGSSIYIFTQKNGVFVETNGILQPWNHELNAKLKTESIITAKCINSYTLAIGTALNGVYLVDTRGQKVTNINKRNALHNNSILSINVDKEQNVWLGLDNGISHIEVSSPIALFTDNTGLLGSVYAVQPHGLGYLLGTNHGVFDWQNNTLQPILGSQGQVWDIHKIENQYVIGHNDGTFLYQNGVYSKGNDLSGGWKLYKSTFDNMYYQSNYSGIITYRDLTQLYKFSRVPNINKPIKNIAQNKVREIWAVDNYRSLFKISFSEDFKTNSVENVSQKNGLTNDFGVKIFNFKNDLFFYINSTWYHYNAIAEKLEPNSLFNTHFKGITDIISVDDREFLVLKDNRFFLIELKKGVFHWKEIPKKYYEGRIINQDTKALKMGNELLLNMDDGFLKVRLDHQKKTPKSSDVVLEAFYKNRLIGQYDQVPHNESIELHLISDQFGYNSPKLFYKLKEATAFTEVERNRIFLSNLSTGNQTLEIYYFNGIRYQLVLQFHFCVARPWYFSFWMLLVYLVVVSVVFYLYYKWNKIRYLAKLKIKEEELKYQNQIQQIEIEAANKLKMQEYEKHILEIQVQTKASEVAGKSLSIAKQTEMIERIETILSSEHDAGQMRSQIKKAIKSNSINKNEWQIFEKNLMKSHEEFVHKITQRFPNLTSKDIKLCIYLRMNLASKEIAPLMNISYRGVELHRYRLRKKMGISKEDNLTTFMINV